MHRREYIVEGRRSIPGWFERVDAEMFDAIDSAQRAAGIVGDILEIGCYQGASAILLGYLRRANERLVICDLFEGVESTLDQFHREGGAYADLSRRSFEENFLRFHEELPEILAMTSTALAEVGFGKTFRIVHVDGSHDYEIVRSDLLLAKSLLIPGGFVIFDDIVARHTPGVTAAVWEGVVCDGLIPVYQTFKLYGTWDEPPKLKLSSEFSQFSHNVSGYAMSQIEYTVSVPRGFVAKLRHWISEARKNRQLNLRW
jgi:hypothetical protein